MKNHSKSLSIFGILLVATIVVTGILKIQQAYAQVDATSSDEVATSSESTPPTPDATTGTTTETATPADTNTTTPTPPQSSSVTPTEPAPEGLTLVHIMGTKYTDYFTDGTTITSYPGDPVIDSNLDKPDAPIPTHEGLTWVHSTGGYLYDTSSGDLEIGQYAVQPDGSYIEKSPPFVSSTSTPATASSSSATSESTPSPEVLGASTSSSNAGTISSTSATDSPASTSDSVQSSSTESSTTQASE